MLIVTTDQIQGKNCEPLGAVRGISVLTRNVGRDIGASFKNLVGGEMKAYQELLDNSSKLALERLVQAAEKRTTASFSLIRLSFGSAEISLQQTGECLSVCELSPDPPMRRGNRCPGRSICGLHACKARTCSRHHGRTSFRLCRASVHRSSS